MKGRLFSKIPLWAYIALAVVLLGTAALVIGGLLAGWDIWGALTSQTAVLIYVLVVIAGVCVAFYMLSKRYAKH